MPGETRSQWEAVLPEFLRHARWFAGKARPIRSVRVLDVLSLPGDGEEEQWFLVLVRIDSEEGEPVIYQIPMGSGDVKMEGFSRGICEAASAPAFWLALWRVMQGRAAVYPETPGARILREEEDGGWEFGEAVTVKISAEEQSHSAAVIGNRVWVKLFRNLWEGENPELEMGRALRQGAFPWIARLEGGLQYAPPEGEVRTLACAHQYIAHQANGWNHALAAIKEDREKVRSSFRSAGGSGMERSEPEAGLLDSELLGRRLGALHRWMAALRTPAFAPELITMEWQGRFCESLREEVGQTLRMLAAARPLWGPELDPLADRLINQQAEMLQIVERLEKRRIEGRLIRCHGDLHLGQVLHTGDEWVIIDFEGEPARSIPVRRLKNLAFIDVAGMLRSFHYAICAAGGGAGGADDSGGWRRATSDRFLHGYFHEAYRGGFLPDAEDERTDLLKICLLRKALYELSYELNHRPDWAAIPIIGLLEIIGEAG